MIIKRWDIVIADLSGAQFSEQGRCRACIVLQGNTGNLYSPTTIIVPLTKEIKKVKQPTHVIVHTHEAPGLLIDSMVLCEQIRTIDKRRILRRVGFVQDENIKCRIIKANRANYEDEVI